MIKAPVLIILAGGKSSRMMSPKGLLDFQGKPWILEQISRFTNVKNPNVYVGLGYDHELYFELIPWFKKAVNNTFIYKGVKVRIIINTAPQYGPFSTLQRVLKNIDPKRTILVHPIDVPFIDEKNLISLINEKNTIVVPVCENKKGHPVKLKPKFWVDLLNINLSSETARLDRQIKNYDTSSVTYINLDYKPLYQNINTIELWNKYLKEST